MSHFGFNTIINGEDYSFKTVDEVEELLADKAANYTLTFVEQDSSTESIDGDTISVSFTPGDGQVQAILDSQNSFLFLERLFIQSDSEEFVDFDYDSAALDEAINNLNCVTDPDATPPTDAYPEFNGVSYDIVEEQSGTEVDLEVLLEVSHAAVLHGVEEVDMVEQNCYTQPAITSTSSELLERIELLNKYTPFALTYTFSDGSTETLDGQTILDWLTITEDESYTIDEDAVASWVSDLASRYSTLGQTRTFVSPADGVTYTVTGGTYGWSIDEDAEIESIINMINNRESETREPYWLTTAAVSGASGEPDWGDTYIELNLTTQKTYLIQDGKVVFSADVVTGLPNGHETPQGVYTILEKMLDKTLVGELTDEGVPEYLTPVSYWMRITWTGIGFHDATWQSSFGGNRYLYVGSHGCINMSLSDAATLYDLIWVGLPVVSHY